MSDLRTFSSSELIITYGSVQLTGWIDGEYLSIDYDDEFFKESNGADGEVGRVRNNKRMATVLARFLQTSASNDALSGYLLGDLIGNNPQNFVAKDLNGNTIFSGDSSYIKKFAPFSYGVDVTGREWTIKVPALLGFLGGNFVG